MKRILKELELLLLLFGFNGSKFINLILKFPAYVRGYLVLKTQLKVDKEFSFGRFSPILNEMDAESGIMKGNYFHQDILVARKIFENKPLKHIDIGSRIDGFVAHVSIFREIEIFDIRPQKNLVKNVKFTQADLTRLPKNMEACCDSISSLHAIEHFGLGRYGDPIDVDGHLKALNTIYSMLSENGTFYFSVPIGKQRIEFNEQRVFSVAYLLRLLESRYTIKTFSYVDDNGNLVEDAELTEEGISSNFNCNYYGCGIFELIKLRKNTCK